MAFLGNKLILANKNRRIYENQIMGISKNPGWVFRDAAEKIANFL
jgi:hypothetical protein